MTMYLATALVLLLTRQTCLVQAQEGEEMTPVVSNMDFTTPYELQMTMEVSESSVIEQEDVPSDLAQNMTNANMGNMTLGTSGVTNNVTYPVTVMAGYTAEDGNPSGMVTVDLSNFKVVAKDKQDALLASIGKSDIDLPTGTNINDLPDALTYIVRCNGKEPAGLKVQLPNGTCSDVTILGTKRIPSQSFFTALVCEQMSPLEAFKAKCGGWSPSEDGMESGTDCKAPAIADKVESTNGTLAFKSLGNELTAMMKPDASNPDLFTTSVVDITTQLEIILKVPQDLMMPTTESNGTADISTSGEENPAAEKEEEGSEDETDPNEGGNRKLLQFEGIQNAIENAADRAEGFLNDLGGRINDTVANIGTRLNESLPEWEQRINDTTTEAANRVADFVNNAQAIGQNVTDRANDFVSDLESRFGGGAEVSGDKVTFKVKNNVVETGTINSVKPITEDQVKTAAQVCAT